MGLVVILVGGSAAADEPEGGVGSEDDSGVVDSTEVGKLHTLEVVIGLQVEGVSSEMGLPLR